MLDTANRVLERYKKERGSCSGAGQRELEKRIPFGEGLKQITGADRPGKAERRLVDRLLHREHEYVDYEELKRASGSEVPNGHDPHAEPEAKTRPTNSGEIKEALDRVREKGFTREEVDRLRKRYLEGTKRGRAKNLPRKKKKRG